jgi:magnesium-transporting ATPase (P-type)
MQRNLEEVQPLILKRKLPAPHPAPVGRRTATAWHSLATEAVLRELDVQSAGLTNAEAAARLIRTGRNEIARRKPVSPLRLLLKQFANFFILVLAQGQKAPADARLIEAHGLRADESALTGESVTADKSSRAGS